MIEMMIETIEMMIQSHHQEALKVQALDLIQAQLTLTATEMMIETTIEMMIEMMMTEEISKSPEKSKITMITMIEMMMNQNHHLEAQKALVIQAHLILTLIEMMMTEEIFKLLVKSRITMMMIPAVLTLVAL